MNNIWILCFLATYGSCPPCVSHPSPSSHLPLRAAERRMRWWMRDVERRVERTKWDEVSHEASHHHSPLLLVPRSFGSVSVLSVHFILTRGAVTSAKREWRTRSEEGRRGEREPEASMSDTRRGWRKRPVGSTRVMEVMGGVGPTGLFLLPRSLHGLRSYLATPWSLVSDSRPLRGEWGGCEENVESRKAGSFLTTCLSSL